MRGSATFLVLYTPNLTQKRKKWFDGRLKVNTEFTKARLIDEDGRPLAERWFSGDLPEVGETVQFSRFIVEIDSVDQIEAEGSGDGEAGEAGEGEREAGEGKWMNHTMQSVHPIQTSHSGPTLPNKKLRVQPPGLPLGLLLSNQRVLMQEHLSTSELHDPPPDYNSRVNCDSLASPNSNSQTPVLPETGPWTQEAYLLFSWHPDLCK